MAYVNLIHNWNFCLGTCFLDVLGICEIMSIRSWMHVFHVFVFHIVSSLVMGTCQAYIGHMYSAYVVHDMHNSILIGIELRIARILLDQLGAFPSIFSDLPADIMLILVVPC